MSLDVIYFGGLNSAWGDLNRQQMLQVPGLQNLAYTGGDGIVTPAFASTIQPLRGGPVYGTVPVTVPVVDMSTEQSAATFRQQYAAAFPSDPINVYSAAAYDSANILIQAIRTALANGAKTPSSSSDAAGASAFRQAVISAVQGISYVGVTGRQSFDQNGDTTNKVITVYRLGLNDVNKPDWIFASTVTVQ
jgi:branched-chain amino acid transport system substrate-binding protein